MLYERLYPTSWTAQPQLIVIRDYWAEGGGDIYSLKWIRSFGISLFRKVSPCRGNLSQALKNNELLNVRVEGPLRSAWTRGLQSQPKGLEGEVTSPTLSLLGPFEVDKHKMSNVCGSVWNITYDSIFIMAKLMGTSMSNKSNSRSDQ